MKRRIFKEALSDAVILSVLVIVPIFFLGPGWQGPSTYQKQGNFARQHESLSGEANEGDEPATTERPRKDRDIPILRAFETERQAEALRRR